MMGKVLWESLKKLVAYDKDIINAEQEIGATQKQLATTQKQIEQFKKQLEDNKQRYLHSQKNIDFYELQAKTLEEKEAHTRDQIDNIKHQKEYNALEKELSALTSQRKELDDLLLNSYHQMDLDKTKVAKDKELFEQKIEQATQDIVTTQEKLKTLEAKIQNIKDERKNIAEIIPADWLSRYERMRHSVTDPIVPVLNECCSACFYAILYQDMVKLKKAGLLPCRSCYRFLYYDEEEQRDDKKASY